MKLKSLHILFLNMLVAVIAAMAMTSCSHKDEPDDPTDKIVPVHRTVLVYMVADNNLGTRDFDTSDIKEMVEAAKAGGLNGGRLLIFHASAARDAVPCLKEVLPDGTISVLKEYDPTISSVAAATMEQAIADTKKFAPANDYGIVLWSHGSGWLVSNNTPDIIDDPDQIRPLSFGQSYRGQNMNIPVLAKTLEGKGFSFIYFDCCYMAGVEVAYELRGVTDYIVGSVTELPNEGMRYDKNISCFFADGQADLVQAARNTYEEYDARTDYNRSCTISVIRTAGLDALAAATKRIYEPVDCTMLPEGYVPQPFMYETTCYHYDLEQYVHALATDPEVLAEWDRALADVVVYAAATPYMWKGYRNDACLIVLDTHCGLSTYIFKSPGQSSKKGYDTTSWFNDVAYLLID